MSVDDVKATTFKENQKKNKIKYKFNFYGDKHKQELNQDHHKTHGDARPRPGDA